MSDNTSPVQFADLRLPVATRMRLDFVGLDYKSHPSEALLLGYRAGESLLVYTPLKPPQVLLADGMKIEAKVVLQMGIVSFTSAIQQICEQPYSYLHLNWPLDAVLDPLRRYPRFPLDVGVNLIALSAQGITTARVRGQFCDISLQGARFGLEKELSTAVSKVMLSAKVTVAGMEHVLDVRGEVRRVFGKDEKAAGGFPFTYGISFIELAPAQRLLLLALCHELQTGSVYGS
jgi:c-di-GMP-binding flagellar brake protein YcgR